MPRITSDVSNTKVGADELQNPCVRCGATEGYSVGRWSDVDQYDPYPLCGECAWGKLMALTKGRARGRLARSLGFMLRGGLR